MSSYRRFVTYLFQYRNGTKGRNCGFSKVETRGGTGRIQIQMKGLSDADYEVYLFTVSKTGVEGIKIGNLPVRQGAGNVTLPVLADSVGDTDFGMDDIHGIYIPYGENGFIASQWDDEEISWESFRVYEKAEARDTVSEESGGEDQKRVEVTAEFKAQNEVLQKQKSQAEGAEQNLQHPAEAKRSAQMSETKISTQAAGAKQDPQHTAEQGETAEQSSEQGKPQIQATQAAAAPQTMSYFHAWEQQWQDFIAKHPLFHPFDEEPGILAVKMDLRDFRIFPKKYQALVNNSFLLHGYFNYKYLLFGYEEGEIRKWFLGIPGSFQNQEQLMAGLFGFPEFRTKHQTKQRTGEFGYWYRYIEF